MSSIRYKLAKGGLGFVGLLFRVVFYAAMAVLIFWAGKNTYDIGYQVFNQQAMSPGEGTDLSVDIPSGSGDYQIGKILEANGLIRDARVFFLQEFLFGYHNRLQSGVFQLSTAYTPARIMSVLAGEEDTGEDSA